VGGGGANSVCPGASETDHPATCGGTSPNSEEFLPKVPSRRLGSTNGNLTSHSVGLGTRHKVGRFVAFLLSPRIGCHCEALINIDGGTLFSPLRGNHMPRSPGASRSRWTRSSLAVAMAGCLVTAVAGAGYTAAATEAAAGGASHYGFDQPSAIRAADHHLWIANLGGDSVTETTVSGAWVKTISAARFGFNKPDAIGVAGNRLLVVNRAGSVTEINATNGALVRVIRGAKYAFKRPSAIVVHSGHVWVTNRGGNSVTEFAAGSGALVRVLRNPQNVARFDDPTALTWTPHGIWVVNAKGNSLTEFDPTNGVAIKHIHAARFGLNGPAGIAFDGRHLWISNRVGSTVTETTRGGSLIQVITNSSNNSNYGFDGPNVVMAAAGYVYINSPLSSSPMVTQINPKTADGDWFECNTNTPTPGWLNPTGLTYQGGHIWVVGAAVGGGSVLVELNAAPSGSAGGQVINRFL
jgi:hypothetical protein